jgi:phosphoglycolate phosphatase
MDLGSPASAPPIRLACIDMAGTVMSDNGVVLDAFQAALEAVGLPPERFDDAMKYARETMGLPKGVVFRGLLADDELVNRAVAAFDASIDLAIKEGRVGEIPGATQAMQALRAGGVKVCLTTGFTEEVQRAVIEHLGWDDAIDFYVGPSATIRGRPYPDMVLTAALRSPVDDVREVAVVGDTANDLWSGYRAGASVVAGVLTGSHERAQLEKAPHTHILSSVADFAAEVLNGR